MPFQYKLAKQVTLVDSMSLSTHTQIVIFAMSE